MRSHRISHSLALAVAALALALAPAAQAGSLLSGYGGPGEGNQAVLGSALTGGPRGGSGGSGGAGGSAAAGSTGAGGSETPADESSETAAGSGSREAPAGGSGTGAARGGTGHAARGRTAAGSSGAKGARSAPAKPLSGLYPVAERVPSGSQGVVLGLTGQDLFFIALAAVLLIAVGLITRRLDRSAGQADVGG